MPLIKAELFPECIIKLMQGFINKVMRLKNTRKTAQLKNRVRLRRDHATYDRLHYADLWQELFFSYIFISFKLKAEE